MQQYAQGDLAGAKATLTRVDAAQLESQQRVQLTDTLAQLSAPAAAPADAATTAAPSADADVMALSVQLRVQEKLSEAAIAEQAGNYKVARRHYADALALDPGNAQAQSSLASVEAKLADQQAPTDVLREEIEGRQLRREATRAEFEELMSRADALAAARDYSGAQEAIQSAKVVIERNQRYLTSEDFTAMRDRANKRNADITAERDLVAQQTTAEIEAKRALDAQQQARDEVRRQREEVDSLIRLAAELRREQQYERSLELVNQALFLEPNNPGAQAMKEMIEDSIILTRARDLFRERNKRIAEQTNENTEASTPYTELMMFPSDWPQLTRRRLDALEQGNRESEANRRVTLRMAVSVPINFEATSLVNVIDYLRNTTGLNFFVNWPALEAAGVEQDTPVTLQLRDVPADQALRLILQQAGAGSDLDPIGYSVIEGVVTISTQRDLTRTTVTRVYDIRDMLVRVPNFTDAPEFDLDSALSNTSSGGSSGGGGGGEGGIFGGDDDLTKVAEEKTREELVGELLTLIRETVGKPDEWADLGGDVSSIKELNGNFIIRTTPDNHRSIIDLLGELRETRAMQIHVEARFLLVDQNYLEEVGFDLDIQVADPGSNWGPIRFSQDSAGMTGRSTSPISGNFGTEADAAEPTFSVPGIPGTFTPGVGFGANNRAMDFGVSYLDDIEVNLLIRATNASRRSISLTAPRITLFNGQRSFVIVARQIAFVSDLEPVSGAVGFDVTISVVQSGVILDVEGTISADRRYVTLTVRPSLATLIRPIRTIGQRSSGAVGGTGEQSTIENFAVVEAPELELTQLKTTASVPDKGTLLLGGQRLVAEIDVEAGVPILSRIPYLNRLFTNSSITKDQRTLLILVKPTILLQGESEEILFPGMLQDPQNYPGASGSL